MNNHLSKEQQQELQQLASIQKKKQEALKTATQPKAMTQLIEKQKRRGFAAADGRIHLCCQGDAKELLMRGLVYFCGSRAQWLPEYEEVVAWMEDNQGKGLMCIGDCGRGKTLITQRILPMLFEKGILRNRNGNKLVYNIHTALDLLDKFKEISYGTLICIDDVGTEPCMKKFGVTHDYFPELVDLCERREKLLICSTNLKVEQIVGGTDDRGRTYEARYDQRTFDRLRSLTRRVFFQGDSMRE